MNESIRNARFAVVDVETTGFHPDRDAVVEVACVVVRGGLETQSFASLVDPARDVPARASAVHHLTAADVGGEPSLARLSPVLRLLCEGAVVVAHNAAFDLGFLPELRERPRLCTLRLARRLFPELEAHANQFLRYALETAVAPSASAHRALHDARTTAAVLAVLLRRFGESRPQAPVAELLALAASPLRFPSLPFGQHRGKPLAQVPDGYLRWLRGRELDADLAATVDEELARRRAEPAAGSTATCA